MVAMACFPGIDRASFFSRSISVCHAFRIRLFVKGGPRVLLESSGLDVGCASALPSFFSVT